MPRYHIAQSGKPAVCKAQSAEACPLGGQHFRGREEADYYVEQTAALMASARWTPPTPKQLEDLVESLTGSAAPDVPRGYRIVHNAQLRADDHDSWREIVLQATDTGEFTRQVYRVNYFMGAEIDPWEEPTRVIAVPQASTGYEATGEPLPADLTEPVIEDMLWRVASKARWTHERYPYTIVDDEVWSEDEHEALHTVTLKHLETGTLVQVEARHNYAMDDVEQNTFKAPQVVRDVDRVTTAYVTEE